MNPLPGVVAWHAAAELHEAILVRTAGAILRRRSLMGYEAEDVANVAWQRCVALYPTPPCDGFELRALMATVMQRYIATLARQQHRQRVDSWSDLAAEDGDESRDRISRFHPATTLDPGRQASRSEQQRIATMCLSQLDKFEQLIVLLHEVEELGHREIGELLGLSEDAVQKRCAKALQSLQRRMRCNGVTASQVTV